MGASLMHAFGILYRLYLCLFILFKFIKIFIGNCSRLRGDKHEKDRHSPCSLRAHVLLRETESEHQINRIISDPNKRYEENNLGWSEKNTFRWSGKASLRRRYPLRSDSRPSQDRGVHIDIAGFRQVEEPALQGQRTYLLRPILWLRSEVTGTGKALSRCKEEVLWIPGAGPGEALGFGPSFSNWNHTGV